MRKSGFFLLVVALNGCAALQPIFVASPDGRKLEALHLKGWLRDHPIANHQEIRVDELGRSAALSFHIVQIRTEEPRHIHQTHDLVAQLVIGRGTFILGSHRFEIEPGSIITIPRGVPHAFVNERLKPAVAFVTSSPPLDLTDRVLLPESSSEQGGHSPR